MIYAYLRVSTNEQNINSQIDKVIEYRPDIDRKNIYIEKDSGKNNSRQVYNKLKKKLQKNDELIVMNLSRLSRKKPFLLREKAFFTDLNIKLRVLNIKTTLNDFPDGQEWVSNMVNNILFEVHATFAEQEGITISQRTKEGLRAARRRGRYGGRPRKDITDIELALKMYKDGYYLSEITKAVNISRSCFYLYLDNRVNELLKFGKTVTEIQEIIGCEKEYVEKRIKI